MKKLSETRKKLVAENLTNYGITICFVMFMILGVFSVFHVYWMVNLMIYPYGIVLSSTFVAVGAWSIITGYFRLYSGVGGYKPFWLKEKKRLISRLAGVFFLFLGLVGWYFIILGLYYQLS